MKIEKRIVTYAEYYLLLNKLVKKLKSDKRIKNIKTVYGIPRGGLPIAVHLSHHLEIDFSTNPFDYPYENTLIVDDIADTGITLKKCGSLYLTATLFYKNRSTVKPDFFIEETDLWVVFPWELSNEIPNRPPIKKENF